MKRRGQSEAKNQEVLPKRVSLPAAENEQGKSSERTDGGPEAGQEWSTSSPTLSDANITDLHQLIHDLLEKIGKEDGSVFLAIYNLLKKHLDSKDLSKTISEAVTGKQERCKTPPFEIKQHDKDDDDTNTATGKIAVQENSDIKNLSKVFNDPIHGHILLDPILVKIINTPQFQRLRNIKQLGGVYFVYPGASHNRFEHSIGVAHLAGELAKALKVKQLEQIKPLDELKELKELKKLTPEELENLKKLQNLKPEDLKELSKLTPEELEKLKKLQNSKPEDLKKLKPEELGDLEKLVELENLSPGKLEELKKLHKLKPGDLKKLKPEKLRMLQRFKPKDVEKLEKLEGLDELKESLISERDVLCVQIAGLCHDLGHGPFSHLFDRMFMPEADKKDNGNWEHEDASVKMFKYLLKKTEGLKNMMKNRGLKIEGKDDTDIVFITELIKGPPKDKDDNELPYEGRDEKKSFLYEIVSNKETGIDVDKFDYFARDCHHLGIRNNFDHKRFIMFARVCDVEKDGSKIKHICSRDKEVANLYDIFQQRHSIHRRACKHKIAVAVEIMIKDALVLADKDEYIQIEIPNKDGDLETFSLSEAKKEMEAYTKLTDQVIERILNSCSPTLKTPREILDRVMKRDLYRCVGQARVCMDEGSEGNTEPEPTSHVILPSTGVAVAQVAEQLSKEDENEQMKKIKEELKVELLERFPEGGEKNFEVIDATLNYGMKNKDPMSKAYVYHKDNPDKGKLIIKSKVSRLLPERFSDEKLMVYWKNYEKEKEREKKENEIKKFFKTWCNKKGFEDVEEEDDTGTSAPSPATPGND